MPLAEVHPIRPRQPRRWLWRLPITLVLVCVGVSVALVAFGHFRIGAVSLGGSVLLATLLRAVLPDPYAGMLAVRSRWTDVITLGVLGVALVVFAVWVPLPTGA